MRVSIVCERYQCIYHKTNRGEKSRTKPRTNRTIRIMSLRWHLSGVGMEDSPGESEAGVAVKVDGVKCCVMRHSRIQNAHRIKL
jgi:hypothetical protein